MSMLVYGNRGQPLKVEPVQPSIAVDSKPNTPTTQKGDQWRPHFEISHADNHNLEIVLMDIAAELGRRAKSGNYSVDRFDNLQSVILGCKP